MRPLLILLALLWWPAAAGGASGPDLEEQTRALSAELRCVVCQNLSVADSPSEMAQQMRAIVREQLEAGKTPEEIKEFFVSKYGEWVLLKPKTSGFSLLLWVLPYVALLSGLAVGFWLLRRWASQKKAQPAAAAKSVEESQRLRREIERQDWERPDGEDHSLRAELLRERARLAAELHELEFDFQAGKHSEAGFAELRTEIENKAAGVIERLNALPAETGAKPTMEKDSGAQRTARAAAKTSTDRSRFRRWQLVAGGSFLLLFGLALGILLTQSLRPRTSEQDTITGDFLTGTSNQNTGALLQQGKQAFAQQEFPQAIEAFKRVLAQDPDQPEAHAYMGFILVQAGHGDGALMAFDRALAAAPNFPMALWGKGMVLYREKQDYPAARAIFEKLLALVPPGDERNEIARVLGEIPSSGSPPANAAAKKSAAGQSIIGTIRVDPKLKDQIDGRATVFIIARQPVATGGPPLAVKRIDKPKFPLRYSLSGDNVMIQGTPFAGSVNLSARLDKDGNAMTRDAGDLLGDYKNNPVAVGSQKVDIVLDEVVK